MSTYGGDQTRIGLEGSVRTREFTGLTDLEVVLSPRDVSDLLLRLIGISHGILDGLVLEDVSVRNSLRIVPVDGGALLSPRIEVSGRDWRAYLPADTLSYCCRFLAEVALSLHGADHIDIDDEESERSITLKVVPAFESVDEQEARRRLGM